MRVLFAHPEPVDPARARWVAMLRTLAAVAERAPVTWFTPDSRDAIDEYVRGHLGLELPPGLTIQTLASARRRLGLITLNRVFFRAFRRAVADAGGDVLWLRSDKLAAYAARVDSPPLVYEAHLIGELYARDKGAPERRARRLAELERRIYGRARGVAAITNGLLDEIRTRFDYNGPAEVLPSAVDTKVFRPVWKGGDGRTVVYVGTQQAWKGLDTLLEAVALTDLRLRVVGEADAGLTARARELGLAGRLEVTGRVPQGEIPALAAGAALAVHPLPPGQSISTRFTSPLKVFEYMAMGLPVVAADVPSMREILTDGRNARLYAAGDADALAAAMSEVAGEVDLARRLSQAALGDAVGCTYERRAERLIGLMATAARVS